MASAREAIVRGLNRVMGARGATGDIVRTVATDSSLLGNVLSGLTQKGTKPVEIWGVNVPLHKPNLVANTLGRGWKKGIAPTVVLAGLAVGVGAGAFRSGIGMEMGQVAPDTLAGSIHNPASPGVDTEEIRPRWHDNDADGSLVLALHNLRRG